MSCAFKSCHIHHGLERIAVYCKLGTGEFGPSLEKCLSNCKDKTITRAEIDNIASHMPEMCELFMREPTESDASDANGGQLTELEMDRMGIRRVADTTDRRTSDKDEQALVHQRVVMLTAAGSIIRRRRCVDTRDKKAADAAQRKANRLSPEEIAQVMQLKENAKRFTQQEKKAEKEAAQQAKQDEKAATKLARETKKARVQAEKAQGKKNLKRAREEKNDRDIRNLQNKVRKYG